MTLFGNEHLLIAEGDHGIDAGGTSGGDVARAEGHRVSSCHLRFLSPLETGLDEIFSRFRSVMTVELNYSDPQDGLVTETQKGRPAQLAMLLRARTLRDIDLRARAGVQVLLVRTPGGGVRVPGPEDVLQPGDRLVCAGPRQSIDDLV